MNLAKINEIRAAAGLAPLTGDPLKAAKAKRQRDNQAKRAAESRELKAKRAKR